MRRLCLLFALSFFSSALSAAVGPAETELAGVTYFAPICPFYYRMMGSDGQLREFRQIGQHSFHSPAGWTARAAAGEIRVKDPKGRRYLFRDGRLAVYENEQGRHAISYPVEPCYAGTPPSLWGLELSESKQKALQQKLVRKTDIWRMTGRFTMGFRSPNAAGGLLAGLALFGIALFLRPRKSVLCLGGLLSLAALTGLLLTGSRGGLVGFAGGLLVLLLLAYLHRAERPVGRRLAVLAVCLMVCAGALLAWKGTGILSRSLSGGANGRGEGSDRISIVSSSLRMMADAPGGWGVRNAGPAYSNWYQPMGGNTWQLTLVSDQLTRLVGYGWLGRGLWIFAWLAVLSLLWTFARRGFGLGGVAIWTSLALASSFNMMLSEPALWVLPVFYVCLLAYRMIRGEVRAWRRYLFALGCSAGASVVALGALFAVCQCASPSDPRIRCDRGVVSIGKGAPEICIVDDGETLGGLYAQNLLRRHYIESPSAPAAAYCRRLADVPRGCRRLVLAGRQGRHYLTLQKEGKAPSAREIVFVSPPFAPKDVPAVLFARSGIGMLLGEFAARYVDVYGEGPPPSWVTVVKGAELYIPRWPDYVIGSGR